VSRANDSLRPLADRDGDPDFDEAWQAQALAIADNLVRNGLFSASDWSAALGLQLAEAVKHGEADTQQSYYGCVLSALETLVAANSDIDRATQVKVREDWEAAYRNTEHGQPVQLK
jgi:nitrile hydratase accessory protein